MRHHCGHERQARLDGPHCTSSRPTRHPGNHRPRGTKTLPARQTTTGQLRGGPTRKIARKPCPPRPNQPFQPAHLLERLQESSIRKVRHVTAREHTHQGTHPGNFRRIDGHKNSQPAGSDIHLPGTTPCGQPNKTSPGHDGRWPAPNGTDQATPQQDKPKTGTNQATTQADPPKTGTNQATTCEPRHLGAVTPTPRHPPHYTAIAAAPVRIRRSPTCSRPWYRRSGRGVGRRRRLPRCRMPGRAATEPRA